MPANLLAFTGRLLASIGFYDDWFAHWLHPPARASYRPGRDRKVPARAPFGPGAVIEPCDRAAGLLDRQRHDGRGHPRPAGGDDRRLEVDPVGGELGPERLGALQRAVLDDVGERQVEAAGDAAAP